MLNHRLNTDYYREERTYKMASEFGVSLTGHKKSLEGDITGGGYVACQQQKDYSAFCAQQTQWS